MPLPSRYMGVKAGRISPKALTRSLIEDENGLDCCRICSRGRAFPRKWYLLFSADTFSRLHLYRKGTVTWLAENVCRLFLQYSMKKESYLNCQRRLILNLSVAKHEASGIYLYPAIIACVRSATLGADTYRHLVVHSRTLMTQRWLHMA